MKSVLLSVDKILINKFTNLFSKNNIEICVFSSYSELLQSNIKRKYILYIIDTNISEIYFLEFAKILRIRNSFSKFVFIFNDNEFDFDCLELDPVHCMCKKYINKDVEIILEKIEKSSVRQTSLYTANAGKRTCTFRVRDVLYIESKKNYCDFVMENRVINIRGTLCEFEEKFSKMGFIRVHSGYIVNFKYIKLFESSDIHLSHGACLPVSRSKYKSSLKKWEYLCEMENQNFRC